MAAEEGTHPDTASRCIHFSLALRSSGHSLPPGQRGGKCSSSRWSRSRQRELWREEEKEEENLCLESFPGDLRGMAFRNFLGMSMGLDHGYYVM